MFDQHYPALVAAYLAALGGWAAANRLFPRLWPQGAVGNFAHPWRELGLALVGVGGILLVGQLWIRGIRLPENGPSGPLLGAVNQLFIFMPILLVLLLRRHPWSSAWLPGSGIGQRLLAGLVLSILAVSLYSFLRAGAAEPWTILGRIWRYDHLDELVQVFLEDVTIAILFVRFAAAVGRRWAILAVACLFAAGHIPAMLSGGASMGELVGLLRDAGLGLAVIYVLQRSGDVLWFWLIHFSMDMTQYDRVTLGG